MTDFVPFFFRGSAPNYLSDLLSANTSVRCLRSSEQKLLTDFRSRLKLRGDSAFFIAEPKMWNSLSVFLRVISTEPEFKSKLKTYLLGRLISAHRVQVRTSHKCLIFPLCIALCFSLYTLSNVLMSVLV